MLVELCVGSSRMVCVDACCCVPHVQHQRCTSHGLLQTSLGAHAPHNCELSPSLLLSYTSASAESLWPEMYAHVRKMWAAHVATCVSGVCSCVECSRTIAHASATHFATHETTHTVTLLLSSPHRPLEWCMHRLVTHVSSSSEPALQAAPELCHHAHSAGSVVRAIDLTAHGCKWSLIAASGKPCTAAGSVARIAMRVVLA